MHDATAVTLNAERAPGRELHREPDRTQRIDRAARHRATGHPATGRQAVRWLREAVLGLLFLLAVLMAATDALAQTDCSSSNQVVCLRYEYTGSHQTFTVPKGVTQISVRIWGAGGGGVLDASQQGGGAGGYAGGTLNVTPGQVLSITVGQGGASVGPNPRTSFGGGGRGGQHGNGTVVAQCINGDATTAGRCNGGGGGGYSAIWNGLQSAGKPMLMAGGGGGAAPRYNNGTRAEGGGGLMGLQSSKSGSLTAGGTVTGANNSCNPNTRAATGGGKFQGGNGGGSSASTDTVVSGGGGGGGYYGGAGGPAGCNGTAAVGGGGGSGYVDTSVVTDYSLTDGRSPNTAYPESGGGAPYPTDSSRGTAGDAGGVGREAGDGLVIMSFSVVCNYWDGNDQTGNGKVDGGSGTWSLNGTNWTDVGSAKQCVWPGNSYQAIFPSPAGVVNITNGYPAKGLKFEVGGYTLTGAQQTIGTGFTVDTPTGTTTTLPGYRDAYDLGLTRGSITFTGGKVIMTGANAYTSTTTVNSGSLQIGVGGTTGDLSGTSGVSLASGTGLIFNRSDDLTHTAPISGAGTLEKQGAGTLTLTGANPFTGATTVTAGTLRLGAGSTSGDLSGTSGVAVASGATLSFHRSDDITFGAPISGAGNVTKLASNKLSTTATHTFTGTLNVSAGTLESTAGQVMGGAGSMNLSSGASLSFKGAGGDFSGSWSLGGTVSYAATSTTTTPVYLRGAVTLSNATLNISGSTALPGNGNFGARFSVEGGSLSGTGQANLTNYGSLNLGKGVNTQLAVAVDATSRLSLWGGDTIAIGSLSGAGTVGTSNSAGGTPTLSLGNDDGSSSFSGVFSNVAPLNASTSAWNLIKAGTGSFTYTGTGTMTGSVSVTGGTLSLGAGGTSGDLASVSGVAVSSGATLAFNRSNAHNFGKVISGAGAVVKQAGNTLTLGGANTYTGATRVNGGTLLYGAASAVPAASALTVAAGATLGLNGRTDVTRSADSSVSGTLDLGSGGAITLTAGTHSIAAITGSGTLTVGNGATLTFTAAIDNTNANLTLAGGTFNTGSFTHRLGAVNATDNSTIDLGSSGSASLTAASLDVASGKTLSVSNWQTGTRRLFATAVVGTPARDTPNLAPLNRVTLAGASAAFTVWLSGSPGEISLAASRVRVVQVSNAGIGTFNFVTTGLNTPTVSVTTATAGTSVSSAALLGTVGTAVTITQTPPSGWPSQPVSIACSDANGAASGNGSGNLGTASGAVVSLPASVMRVGADLACTFTNVYNGIRGVVFNDGGAPSLASNTGTPNDGLRNGSEAGIGGVSVQLSNCASTVHGSALTDDGGNFSLAVPLAQVGQTVCLSATLPNGYLATGANAAGTVLPSGSATTVGGRAYTYSRGASQVSFTAPSSGAIVLHLGAVPPSKLAPTNSARLAGPGVKAIHALAFTAGTGGQLQVQLGAGAASPALAGWSEIAYLDSGCSGSTQTGGTRLYPSGVTLTVVQGQVVCFVVEEQVPVVAANGNSNAVPVTATLTFSNAAPALSASYVATATTTASTSAVTLTKEVRNVTQGGSFGTFNQAKSGDTLEYRITYANTTTAPVLALVIHDGTPTYTTFLSASAGTTPSSLGACTKETPANPSPAPAVSCAATQPVGGTGALSWRFAGTLQGGATGNVLYQIKVD
jgi:uncharacterized repeat protein (TIGR01451 family)